jgi:uncharacterized protein (DUF1697 family)
MANSGKSWIVLLRAIGPATHKKMSMQQLRDDCMAAGLENVRTYIASGNLLCNAPVSKNELQKLVENILSDYGLNNDVIIRTKTEMKSILDSSPLPEAANVRPNHLLTVFYNRKINLNAAKELLSREFSERIVILDRELCIDYVNGVANSKLTPALIDRVLGQSGTARNWNTVGKLVSLIKDQ